MKILEIGSCSMLDHDYSLIPGVESWDKLVHKNIPKHFTKIFNEETIKSINLDEYDIIIFSRSIRDKNIYINSMLIELENQLEKSTEVNIVDYTNKLNWILKNTKNKTFVLLSSECVDRIYESRPIYAATKAYQSNYFRNMASIHSDSRFFDLRIPSVKTNMCNHGLDSLEVTKKIFEKILSHNYTKGHNHLTMNI